MWLVNTGVEPLLFKISRFITKIIEIMLAKWNGKLIAVSYLLK